MIRLFVTKEQGRTILEALESKRQSLRNSSHDPALKNQKKEIGDLLESEIFQIDLLATYLEKATDDL